MPELPEVETIARALRPHLVGASFVRWKQHIERLRLPLPDEKGRRQMMAAPIVAVWRRAKILVIELANRCAVLIHLGMTGSLRVCSSGARRFRHEHVVLTLDDHRHVRYNDPRRFGFIIVVRLPAAGTLPESVVADLGPEPLDDGFSAAYLQHCCRATRRAIKLVIMDNRVVVGVGNIYASESLFRARIHPLTPASALNPNKIVAVRAAIVDVLNEAIAAGGTTISDFRSIDGSEGHFAQHLSVYDRAGEPCERCRVSLIERTIVGGRSSYHCPSCQPRSRSVIKRHGPMR